MKRSNSADSSMNLSVDAAEHGRCDAEAERGVMFQSRSSAADSNMNLSVELAEYSARMEKYAWPLLVGESLVWLMQKTKKTATC